MITVVKFHTKTGEAQYFYIQMNKIKDWAHALLIYYLSQWEDKFKECKPDVRPWILTLRTKNSPNLRILFGIQMQKSIPHYEIPQLLS